MMSATAFGMTELFSMVNEARPRQSNIILDACQSAGVVEDLHSLTKPELIGGSHTPSITIFVSSATDQYSAETPQGGVGTTHLMQCVTGSVVVQTQRPTLDLLEIGRTASSLVTGTTPTQVPTLWGLNLYGEARFCKNPHFAGAVPNIGSLPHIPLGSPQHAAIESEKENIWREFLSVEGDFEPRRFLTRVRPILSSLASDPVRVAAFTRGLAEAFRQRAETSRDVFRGVEVVSGSVVTLLEHTGHPAVDASVGELSQDVCALNRRALEETAALLEHNRYALLSDAGGFGDLFYMPLRLSRILGWVGAHHFACKWLGSDDALDTPSIHLLLNRIFEVYSPSFVALSDLQSPYLLTFLLCCRERGWVAYAESLVGHIFNSFVACRGHVARPDIDKNRVFEFLNRRREMEFNDAFDIVALPSEMLSVILMASCTFDLRDVVDPYLQELDHTALNQFIPRDHRHFGKRIIRDGVNHTHEIGRGVWTTDEFSSVWNTNVAPQIASDSSVELPEVKAAALFSALLFPDRCPWFLAREG